MPRMIWMVRQKIVISNSVLSLEIAIGESVIKEREGNKI